MAVVEWFYELDGFRRGPVTPAALKQLADSGQITPETRIWKEGLSDWAKAGAVRGLFAAASPTATRGPSADAVKAATASQERASSPAPVTGRDWYYSVNGEKLGPVGSADLKRLADTNALSPSDLVWKQGLTAWVTASSVKGLFAQPTASQTSASNSSSIPPELPSIQPPPIPAATAAVSFSAGVAGSNSLPLHVQRVGIAIAAFLGGAATFMPWANLPIVGAVDGTVGDGWITLALFAVALAVSFYGDRGQPISSWPQVTATVLPALAGIIGVWKIIQINGIASDLRSKADSVTLGGAMAGLAAQAVRPKFGLYMLVMASLAAAVAAVILHPQRFVRPTRMPSLGHFQFLRRISLPLHGQRLAVVLLSLVGATAVFMPWLRAVDSAPAVSIDVSRATPQEIVEARAINLKYVAEMGLQMGKRAETLRDVQSAMGPSLFGGLTLALFVAATACGLYGVRTRALTGWVRLCVIIPPLIASGIGLWEWLRVGAKDEAVRNAVQEFVRERGHDIELPRLKEPVMQAGYGLWVVFVSGIMTAAAAPLLGSTKAARDGF